ncbi:MAG: FmdB family zinc ribbon protein [Planctomycetota bacterium]|jgi:putative FmdB family regulatory protein
MPTYEYECQACEEVHEVFHGMNEPGPKKCPTCGKRKLKKLLSAGAGFIFKGDGFYTTDYRSKDYKEKAKKDKDAASAKKSDSKPCESSGSSDVCKTCPSAKKKD